jgi:hypothetical protein
MQRLILSGADVIPPSLSFFLASIAVVASASSLASSSIHSYHYRRATDSRGVFAFRLILLAANACMNEGSRQHLPLTWGEHDNVHRLRTSVFGGKRA